jgi:GlpG protein
LDESNSISESLRKLKPYSVTLIGGVISILLFIAVNLRHGDYILHWLAPGSIEIFEGKFWGLITSNFIHIEVWHILGNLSFIWYTGKQLELHLTRTFYLFLIFSSALVSSLAQMGFDNSNGIGLSGIGYCFFGYMVVQYKWKKDERFFLDPNTYTVGFVWLFLCFILTYMEVVNIGNAAHVGGICWGMLLAFTENLDAKKRWLTGIAFHLLLMVAILFNPFNVTWISYKAYRLHVANDIDNAELIYKEILNRNNGNEFATFNLRLIKIQRLGDETYKFHKEGNIDLARKKYLEILELDPENEWAKENLILLPKE